MDFVGTGERLKQGDIDDAARALGVETAVLLAFLEVEAAGRGFDNRNRPKMLFEPHVFWRNLQGAYRDVAAKLGLAYPKWRRDYPADSYPRLEKAIDRVAREPAFRSASYGLPQILGENHNAAGFQSAEAMFVAMKKGEREQLFAMVALLKAWGLAAKLVGKDFTKADSWRPAAKAYNGAGYAANGYHTKLAAAYLKHAKEIDAMTGTRLPPKTIASAVLELGVRGEAVRALQADLETLGYKFVYGLDGRFGNETDKHVRAFQVSEGLTPDGKVGDKTQAALARAIARMKPRIPTSGVGEGFRIPDKKGVTPTVMGGIVALIAALGAALGKALGLW